MNEFQEYPKWLDIGDGRVVWNKEEEDSARAEHQEETKEEAPRKPGRPRKA